MLSLISDGISSGNVFSDLIYDFMSMLSKRLEEVDVSTILTVLQCKHLLNFELFFPSIGDYFCYQEGN